MTPVKDFATATDQDSIDWANTVLHEGDFADPWMTDCPIIGEPDQVQASAPVPSPPKQIRVQAPPDLKGQGKDMLVPTVLTPTRLSRIKALLRRGYRSASGSQPGLSPLQVTPSRITVSNNGSEDDFAPVRVGSEERWGTGKRPVTKFLSARASPKAKRPHSVRCEVLPFSHSQPLPSAQLDYSPEFPKIVSKNRGAHQEDLHYFAKKPDNSETNGGKVALKGNSLLRPLWDQLQQVRPDILDGFSQKKDALSNLNSGGDTTAAASASAVPNVEPRNLAEEFNAAVESLVPPIDPRTRLREMRHKRRRFAKLERPAIQHRPLTRSMSKIRKVHIHYSHFSPSDELELPWPGAEYMVGQLVEIVECPLRKVPLVIVSLKGFNDPQEFLASQVMIGPPVSLLPNVEYVDACVCCKPAGEEDLPSNSSTGDSDFTTESDPIPANPLEADIEADRDWTPMSPNEFLMLKHGDEHFRYYGHLPFEKKYHDFHWIRDYRGNFGSSRSWLGQDEIGVPLIDQQQSPLDIFNSFITNDTWIKMVKETNRYAKQKDRKGWKPLCVAELKCWLGICIFMGIKKLPELTMHWSKCHPVLVNHFFSDLMACDRWLDIMAMLHLVDNSKIVTSKDDPSYDKVVKVRWLMDEVCGKFRELKPVDRYLSVDEMMVKCLARRCPVKQYNKDKPIPHGIKVWALASASTNYVYALDVFCGAQSGPGQPPHPTTKPQTNPEDKATYKVVMQLMQHVPSGLGHVITMDNYFTGVPLFVDLLSRRIFCTGTARPGILGWPASMSWNKRLKGKRGDLRWRMHYSKEIGSCVWFDKKPVGILSTFALPWASDATVNRREGAEVVEYHTSPSLLSYVKLMRGVDVADQIRGGYSISRRGRRWWKRLFFFIMDCALCNAWVVAKHKWQGGSTGEDNMSKHLAFNMALADCLVADWKKKRNIEMNDRICAGIGKVAHGPSRSASQSRTCVECGRRTYWRCLVCPRGPHMCVAQDRTCYQLWHQKRRTYI